jgi:hypothetical protein
MSQVAITYRCHCEAATAAEAISPQASRMFLLFLWNLRLLRRLRRLATIRVPFLCALCASAVNSRPRGPMQAGQFLKEFPLPRAQPLGDLDLDDDVEVAPAFGVPRLRGIPFPRRRNLVPLLVPGGIFSETVPSSVSTGTSPPRTAV